MATIPKMQVLAFFILALSIVSSSCYPTNHHHNNNHNHIHSNKYSKIKGMFVFGTSVVDNGNNNYINTLGKVNYLPYGIDFPLGATGRFSNGRNAADCIAQLLGLPNYVVPPFADPNTKGNRILYGVNFGSGGSGILDSTGSITGGVITLNEQIKNFEKVTLPQMKDLVRSNKEETTSSGREWLDEYLFVVAAGNNDLGLNYFLQDKSSRPPLPTFVANLTSTYATQLQRLYKAGARKFALLTVYPIGCSPATKQLQSSSNSNGCVDTANAAANYLNTQYITMVDALKQRLPGSHFVVVNTYNIILDIINNPSATGFKNVTGSCCELKEIMGVGITCKENGKICNNREVYVYFDGQHNTEAVNSVIANKAFFSRNKSEAYPFNLHALALL